MNGGKEQNLWCSLLYSRGSAPFIFLLSFNIDHKRRRGNSGSKELKFASFIGRLDSTPLFSECTSEACNAASQVMYLTQIVQVLPAKRRYVNLTSDWHVMRNVGTFAWKYLKGSMGTTVCFEVSGADQIVVVPLAYWNIIWKSIWCAFYAPGLSCPLELRWDGIGIQTGSVPL